MRMRSYKYTKELDDLIRNYCFAHFLSINDLFRKAWLSWATYYWVRTRWIISLRTAQKLDKILWFVIDTLWKDL